MKRILRLIGITILLAVLLANLVYAYKGYGVSDNALAQDVWDQTNFAGD